MKKTYQKPKATPKEMKPLLPTSISDPVIPVYDQDAEIDDIEDVW